jgi:chromosome segregation DNA-binding protein
MDEGALYELAESIKAQGVMQPILVRPLGEGRFEIIAGERRTRAARLAGLDMVPVLVREVPDQAALAMALIENIQREDLNPLEEAQGIQRLIAEFSFTHEQAAQAVGRSRTAVSNLLRLINLAAPVQAMLLAGDLDMGHARALLALDGAAQLQVAQQVHAKRLSVRETERLCGRAAQAASASPPPPPNPGVMSANSAASKPSWPNTWPRPCTFASRARDRRCAATSASHSLARRAQRPHRAAAPRSLSKLPPRVP